MVMYDYFDYHGHMCIAFELLGNINNNSFTKYSLQTQFREERV